MAAALALAPLAPSAHDQDNDPAAQLNLVRNALRVKGGTTLRGVTLRGMTQEGFKSGASSLNEPRPLEIVIVLPNQYVRIDTIFGSIRTVGFRGETPVNEWRATDDEFRVLQSRPAEDALTVQRATLARLMLGLTAETRTALPVNIRRVTADGQTLLFECVGRDDFLATLVVDAATRLPLAVRFPGTARFPRSASSGGKQGVTPPAPLRKTEWEWRFDDRRVTSGIRLPYSISRVAEGVVFERISVNEFVLNLQATR